MLFALDILYVAFCVTLHLGLRSLKHIYHCITLTGLTEQHNVVSVYDMLLGKS